MGGIINGCTIYKGKDGKWVVFNLKDRKVVSREASYPQAATLAKHYKTKIQPGN